MKAFCLILYLIPITVIARHQPVIETSDITHFWAAYDKLPQAHSTEDSVRIIQEGYFDTATPYFNAFVKARHFTPEEYVALIRAYPAFWKSIRPLTEDIASREAEIVKVFDKLGETLPSFKRPDVCFAIGGLRTGGTTSKDLILIGAEIAAADTSVDKTGMNTWLQSVLGKTGDIVSMVAHEAVHTQQGGFPFFELFSLVSHHKLNLLNMAIVEGSADFITTELLGLNINDAIHDFGDAHRCALWKEFKDDIDTDPFDYSRWLYNGSAAQGRPADLAYYIGHEITRSYYDQQEDKRRTLKTILRIGKYKRIVRQSQFEKLNCA
jgi:hypothetical protein